MKICVVGLGHVGTVNIAYLLERGHIVTGLDVSQERIRHLFAGEPEPEPRVSELLSSALRSGRLQLSTDYLKAVEEASVAIICVGTPQREKDGIPNLSFLYQAVTSLVEIVNKKRDTSDVCAALFRPGRRVISPLEPAGILAMSGITRSS